MDLETALSISVRGMAAHTERVRAGAETRARDAGAPHESEMAAAGLPEGRRAQAGPVQIAMLEAAASPPDIVALRATAVGATQAANLRALSSSRAVLVRTVAMLT